MSARLILIAIIFSLTTIALAQGTLSPGFYDDRNASLSYPNGRSLMGGGSFYASTASYANRMEFDFESASGFTVYGQKNSNTAPVEVCVDGSNCHYFGLDELANGYIGALFTVSGLSFGFHEVSVQVDPYGLGFPFVDSINFDAVEILPPPPPTATATNTPIPSDTPVPTNTAVPTITPTATSEPPHLTIPIDAEDLEIFFAWFGLIFGVILPIALIGAGLTAGAVFAFVLGRVLRKTFENLSGKD